MSVLIKNASFVLTQNPKREILKDADILIEDDKIAEIGKNLQTTEFVIDGKNKLVMPGLINSHTHLAMTLFRGVADDLSFFEAWPKRVWVMESNLTEKDVYYGSLLGCIEMIKSGTTCFGDMYFYMTETAKAVVESGIRGMLSQGILENLPKEIAGFDVAKNFVKYVKDLKNDRVLAWMGPHSTYTCSPETLKEIKDFAQKENLRINIHLSEFKSELEQVKEKYGKTPVELLNDLNFLGEDVTAVHCVHLTEKEIKILKEKNVKVVHNPCSNMKLASGIAPIPELLKENICVALGTDGAVSNNSLDMFQEMKFAALLHKVNKFDTTTLPAQQVLDFATINGAKALGLEKQIGSIEVGKKADIIVLNINKPHFRPILSDNSIVSHLVYSATGSDVETVIVDGEVVMKNRELMTIDENEIIKKFQDVAQNLQRRSFKSL